MASIFKNNIIKRKIDVLNIPDFENKIKIVKRWHNDFYKGTLKEDKETSREQAYNQDFFIKILGYEEKPQTPYTLEPKATTEKGQLPDLVLGYFDNDNKNISAVVELKGAKILLDRPQQREGNHSPIQQAFKYKTQYSHCPFVIASNFFEIRLFQDNQLDYEIWNLDDLVNPENDYFQFKKFYFLLNKENFTSLEGKTKTEELLSDIRVEEEKISKKFYKEYRELRTELLRNIYKKNLMARENIDLAIEKAQKIIDRIVFVCFCEDQDLLPENTLQRVLMMSEKGISSLWDNIKGFFNAIDQGSLKLEIPKGYNGGLFKSDNILDSFKIDDDILKKFANLGKYNFREDLNVNILGHIFEQSISDLEDIKIKVVEKKGIEEVDNVGKRKKDGIFYTPDYIVDYIIKNSLGKYLEDKESELKEKYKLKKDILDANYQKRETQVYEDYRNFLENIKVLDPACGSGAFLVKVFDYLLEENKRVGHILGDIFSSDDGYYRSILKNNIFGVDLNSESVEITKLSLWLKTAQKGKQLTTLDKNIKCGNSLIDDNAIAGDKAFDWSKEFKVIMEKGGFDVVVGNPPYVNIANVSDEKVRKYFKYNYKTVKNKSDLYSIFIEKATGLLKKGGLLSFVFSNSWLGTDSFSEFRKFLLEETSVLKLVKLPKGVFEDAVVTAVIIVLSNLKPKKNNKIELLNFSENKFNKMEHSLNYEKIKKSESFTFSFEPEINFKSKVIKLDKIAKFSLGIKTSDDKKFIFDEKKDNNCYPILRGKDIQKYYSGISKKWIWYRPDLMMEKVGAGPRCLEYFLKPKIFIQDISKSIIACYDENNYLSNDTLSLIYAMDRQFSFKYILVLLNSKFVNKWFDNNFPEGLHIKINQLKQIPVSDISEEKQKPFIELADKMLVLNKEFYEKINSFLLILKTELVLLKINKKLQKFYELDTEDFLKEIKISDLNKKAELMKFFEENKKDVLELKQKIESTDKKIDQMVYELYGLDDKDIKIIEDN